jgi:hypothetical protein
MRDSTQVWSTTGGDLDAMHGGRGALVLGRGGAPNKLAEGAVLGDF